MELSIIDSIDDISRADFDRLDSSAGSAGCYSRTRQREADGRWRTRYLRAVENGRLGALIPLHTAHGRNWPDPMYDPTHWELPAAEEDYRAGRCLLVGSFADLRTGWPVAPDLRDPAPLRRILTGIARHAAEQDRCLVFAYLFSDARRSLAEASDGAISWTRLAQEGHLHDVSEPGWLDKLAGPIRYNLRRDQKRIAKAGVVSDQHAWPDVEEAASVMIAEHNVRKGGVDHAEFVKMRNQQWHACDGVELMVLSARSANASGYLTLLVWQDSLELYEIGLQGEHGPERLAVYLELMFHRPLRLAQERGLRLIRLGQAAEQVKAGRGAVLEDLYGGVLALRDTQDLALSSTVFDDSMG